MKQRFVPVPLWSYISICGLKMVSLGWWRWSATIFSKSIKHTDLGVWLLGFAKLISPGVKFCCHFMPAGATGIKADGVLAKCRHTHTHVNTRVHIRTHRSTATPWGSHRQAHTASTTGLSCSPFQLRKSAQRHWENHTFSAYTSWRGSYTGKEKKSHHNARLYHPQQKLHPAPWGFPRRAPEQSRLPRQRCRMQGWRLSLWGLANPRLAQPPVVLLKRRRTRSKLSLKWGSRASDRGREDPGEAGQGQESAQHPPLQWDAELELSRSVLQTAFLGFFRWSSVNQGQQLHNLHHLSPHLCYWIHGARWKPDFLYLSFPIPQDKL